jgi:hypothetical protein
LPADPRWAPFVKKRSGRCAARLREDGITARLSYRFNILAIRGQIPRSFDREWGIRPNGRELIHHLEFR